MVYLMNLLASTTQSCELGADVIHPAPGTVAKPSYTSVVGSLDSHAVKYVPTTSVQEGRQEMIADMKGMCKVCDTMAFQVGSKLRMVIYTIL